MKGLRKARTVILTVLLACAVMMTGSFVSAAAAEASASGIPAFETSWRGGSGSSGVVQLKKKKKKKNKKNKQNKQNGNDQNGNGNGQNGENSLSTGSGQESAPIQGTGSASDLLTVEEDGSYTSKEEVALYIHTYGRLPDNYITKREAEDLGWSSSAGNLWDVAPGKSIGGSRFGNYEGNLPEANGRKYYECDIDYEGGRRSAKRIVFSNDGLIFYTEDHYRTFELLYGEEDIL